MFKNITNESELSSKCVELTLELSNAHYNIPSEIVLDNSKYGLKYIEARRSSKVPEEFPYTAQLNIPPIGFSSVLFVPVVTDNVKSTTLNTDNFGIMVINQGKVCSLSGLKDKPSDLNIYLVDISLYYFRKLESVEISSDTMCNVQKELNAALADCNDDNRYKDYQLSSEEIFKDNGERRGALKTYLNGIIATNSIKDMSLVFKKAMSSSIIKLSNLQLIGTPETHNEIDRIINEIHQSDQKWYDKHTNNRTPLVPLLMNSKHGEVLSDGVLAIGVKGNLFGLSLEVNKPRAFHVDYTDIIDEKTLEVRFVRIEIRNNKFVETFDIPFIAPFESVCAIDSKNASIRQSRHNQCAILQHSSKTIDNKPSEILRFLPEEYKLNMRITLIVEVSTTTTDYKSCGITSMEQIGFSVSKDIVEKLNNLDISIVGFGINADLI